MVPALGGLHTYPGGVLPNGIGFGPNAVAVGDFNGDGKPDVVTTGSAGISIQLNDGIWPPLPPPGGGGGGGGGA